MARANGERPVRIRGSEGVAASPGGRRRGGRRAPPLGALCSKMNSSSRFAAIITWLLVDYVT